MKRVIQSAIAAAIVSLAATTTNAATLIDTTGVGGGFGFNCLGVDSSCGQTFGQSFTVGADTTLDDIAFSMTTVVGGSLDVVLRIFRWDGADRVGSQLFASAVTTLTTGGLQTWSVGETLTTGLSYIAYLDTAGLGNSTGQQSGFNVVTNSAYTGGTFGWERTSGNNTWNSLNSYDAAFRANFTAAVPVPAALPLLGGGLGLMGLFGWRRKRALTA